MPRTLPRRAFTLMELLIVVAVIALLVGIVAVTLRGVRGAAARTESLSALRQMAMGYSLYSQDNNGRLLPGYIDTTLMVAGKPFENLSYSLSSGPVLTDVDMQSYVWRLAPYVDDSWQTFFEETDAATMAKFSADYQKMLPTLVDPAGGNHDPGFTSEHPSFGLNSIFVGGDSAHGGVGDHNPWGGDQPEKAATRLSHVLNPTKLIVFAPTARAAALADDVYDNVGPDDVIWPGLVGSCELRAPFLTRPADTWDAQQWLIGSHGRVTQASAGVFDSGGGLPIARTAKDVLNGGKEPFPVVHLDVSTAVQQMVDLSEDMRHWTQRRDVR